MIIVRDEKFIQRNARIGSFVILSAVIILGAGMYLTIKFQDQYLYPILAFLVGFPLSQIGLLYLNRFGRKPRLDELLDRALKGLDKQYVLYHYQTPVPHLLVGPAGLWILFPYSLRGTILYNEHRKVWKHRGGNQYLKLFGQEMLGKPAREIKSARNRLRKDLEKIPHFTIPEIKSALVFTDPKVKVNAHQAPVPTLHASQIKKLIRKEAKGNSSLSTHLAKTIQDFYGLGSPE